jgi:hypothetical protein
MAGSTVVGWLVNPVVVNPVIIVIMVWRLWTNLISAPKGALI